MKKIILIIILSFAIMSMLFFIAFEKPIVTIYEADFSKYEFPLGTSKNDIDELLGQPYKHNGFHTYWPKLLNQPTGFQYSMKYDDNNKLIYQDIGVGCTPNKVEIRDFTLKEKIKLKLKYPNAKILKPGEFFLRRIQSSKQRMDLYLKNKNAL